MIADFQGAIGADTICKNWCQFFIWFASKLITQTHCTFCVYITRQDTELRLEMEIGEKKKGKTRTDYKLLMALRWLPHMSATTFFLFFFWWWWWWWGGGIFKNRWNKKETLKKWLSWQLMPLHLISIFLIYTHAYQLFKNESIYVRRPCIFI